MNLSETFEWNGLWTTVKDQAAASEVLTHDPGWWNMTLTARKTVEGGKESYFMKFDGAHNTGPTELFQPFTLNTTFSPLVHSESLSHGGAMDLWKISITPDSAQPNVVRWSVTANHVVPEPAVVAVATGAGLLLFGLTRAGRRRFSQD